MTSDHRISVPTWRRQFFQEKGESQRSSTSIKPSWTARATEGFRRRGASESGVLRADASQMGSRGVDEQCGHTRQASGKKENDWSDRPFVQYPGN
ncbi:hypothetical protein [Mycolicibacterium goodii]|uniref:hypothetical protein n=1 Tax=Mycolicibacterium goodii TaxID=134601 RepID=UPI0012FF764C